MELKYCDELVDIVEAATTAGWLEAKGEILLDDEDDLTEFLIEHRKQWQENGYYGKSFAEYIVEKLLEKYAMT